MVIEDMKARDKMGEDKYKTRLQAGNGRNPLQDAYEESLDQTVYIKQELEERKKTVNVEEDHHAMVAELAADPGAGRNRLARLTYDQINLLHGAIGLVTEAGELLDAIKRAIFYGTGFDMANILEEMGDAEFYLDLCRSGAGVSRRKVLRGNTGKLHKRYPDGRWTKEGATNRDLVSERAVLEDAAGRDRAGSR